MGRISIWHWAILFILYIVPFLSSIKILRKSGRSRWYAIVMLIPIANIIGMYVFALSRWPSLQPKQN